MPCEATRCYSPITFVQRQIEEVGKWTAPQERAALAKCIFGIIIGVLTYKALTHGISFSSRLVVVYGTFLPICYLCFLVGLAKFNQYHCSQKTRSV